MPSSRVQARETETPRVDAVSGPPAADTLDLVTELSAAAPSPRAIWPWWVGAVLIVVAVIGWLAPWAGNAPPPTTSAREGVAVIAVDIERGEMRVRRRYPGELFADAVEITSRIPGHVAHISVRIGDRVQAGQVLSRLDDAVLRRRVRETEAQIRAQRATVRNAGIAVAAARRDLERARRLLPSGAVSRQEIDEIDTLAAQREAEQATAQAQLEEARARLAVLKEDLGDTSIRAPFDGVVARRDVNVGAFVQPGVPLVRLVAEDPLRVRFRVPEYEIVGLTPGLEFDLDIGQVAATRATGHVDRLSGEVSSSDRTLVVEGIVEAHEGVRPGMYADVVLRVEELTGVPIVPGAALIERVDSQGRASRGVFVVDEEAIPTEHSARWVDVRVLGREADRVAVEAAEGASAFADGTRVLVRGHRELPDGARIRLVDADEGGGS